MQGLLVEGKEISKDFSHEWVQGNADLTAIEKGIPIASFRGEMAKRDLEMEFRLLRRLTETQYHNENLYDFHPDILKLNRYNNIIPCKSKIIRSVKHSIVKLKSEGEDEENHKENYINANFINVISKWEGEDDNCNLGPFDLNIQPFLENDCLRKYEHGRDAMQFKGEPKSNVRFKQAQCEQYWPRNVGDNMLCGNITINMISQDEGDNNITKRVLKVSQEGGEQKTITQLQWCGWPDQGVPSPSDYEVLIYLLSLIIEQLENDQKVVFHCSAGVGRTGTLISLTNIMILLKAYRKHIGDETSKAEENAEQYRISIFGIVRRLREQRWGMVHTSEQYSYIYKFVDEAIKQLFGF